MHLFTGDFHSANTPSGHCLKTGTPLYGVGILCGHRLNDSVFSHFAFCSFVLMVALNNFGRHFLQQCVEPLRDAM